MATTSTRSDGGRSEGNIFGGVMSTLLNNVKYAKFNMPNGVTTRARRGGRWDVYEIFASSTSQRQGISLPTSHSMHDLLQLWALHVGLQHADPWPHLSFMGTHDGSMRI